MLLRRSKVLFAVATATHLAFLVAAVEISCLGATNMLFIALAYVLPFASYTAFLRMLLGDPGIAGSEFAMAEQATSGRQRASSATSAGD